MTGIWALDYIGRKLEGGRLQVHPMFPVVVLGRNSLLIYIFHTMFISYFFVMTNVTMNNGLGYLVLILCMLVAAYAREFFIKDVKKVPTLIRLIAGI